MRCQAAEPETLWVLGAMWWSQCLGLASFNDQSLPHDVTNTCLGDCTQVWKPMDPMDLVSSHSFL